MSLRIGDYVISGELRNTRRNGVFGWIEFAPDYGIRIELTGNLAGVLQGKHVRFRAPARKRNDAPDPHGLPEVVEGLADRQIGVVGEMLLKKIKVPDVSVDEFLSLDETTREQHLVEKDCLFLEWFSQNGRVIAEIVGPEVDLLDDAGTATGDSASFEPLENGGYGLGFTEVHIDEGGNAHTERFDLDSDEDDEDSIDDDPYGLFGEDLGKHLADSLGIFPEEQADGLSGAGQNLLPDETRPWNEISPDVDPETQALYAQWDEIFEGKKDEPISYLFQTPLKLPKAENVTTDEEAEPLVREILAQLALLSVALDVCEHYTPCETYRLLMKSILPTAKVHPNLAASDMVQHYSTSDYCEKCDEEFDDGEDYDAPDDVDSGGNEDIPF